MLSRSLAFISKSTPALTVAVLLFSGRISGFADEPVEKKEPAKTLEPAAPEHKNLLNYRAYRPGDSIFNKSSTLNRPDSAVPPPRAAVPRASRSDLERLDREKNWIFVRPGDENKDGSMKDGLGAGNLFDDGKPKSVITKFLEHQSGSESKSADANANGFNYDPRKNVRSGSVFGFENRNSLDASQQFGGQTESLFGGRSGPSSVPEQWQALHGPQAEKMRGEKRTQMNEFENLFNPQNIAPQKDFNSSAGNYLSSDLDPYRRNTPSPTDAFRNPATAVPTGLPTAPTFNSRAYGSPTPALPTPAPARRVEQPIVLPMPRRHF